MGYVKIFAIIGSIAVAGYFLFFAPKHLRILDMPGGINFNPKQPSVGYMPATTPGQGR